MNQDKTQKCLRFCGAVFPAIAHGGNVSIGKCDRRFHDPDGMMDIGGRRKEFFCVTWCQ